MTSSSTRSNGYTESINSVAVTRRNQNDQNESFLQVRVGKCHAGRARALRWTDPIRWNIVGVRAERVHQSKSRTPNWTLPELYRKGGTLYLERPSPWPPPLLACSRYSPAEPHIQHMCRWMRGRAQKWCWIGITILPVVGETNELLPQHPSRSRTEESSFVHNPIHLSLEMSSAIHTSAI